MLVYLTAQTWTRGKLSAQLGAEVLQAMDLGVHLLLAHEMPGVGGQEARSGCDFGAFFSCEAGSTPAELLVRGIYNEIALPLKGGAWREPSLALLFDVLAATSEHAEPIHIDAHQALVPARQLLNALQDASASLAQAATGRMPGKRPDAGTRPPRGVAFLGAFGGSRSWLSKVIAPWKVSGAARASTIPTHLAPVSSGASGSCLQLSLPSSSSWTPPPPAAPSHTLQKRVSGGGSFTRGGGGSFTRLPVAEHVPTEVPLQPPATVLSRAYEVEDEEATDGR